MENENDSLARTAHAFGMTDLEFEERSRLAREVFRPAEDLPMPPPLPEGVRPLPRVENSPSELDELVLDCAEDYGDDWEEYMLHGDPNWD